MKNTLQAASIILILTFAVGCSRTPSVQALNDQTDNAVAVATAENEQHKALCADFAKNMKDAGLSAKQVKANLPGKGKAKKASKTKEKEPALVGADA